MTTIKPEILGYCAKRDREPWERSNNCDLIPNHDDSYTVPVIRLSDYEKLREDVVVLVEALQAISRNELDAQRAQSIASIALAAYHKGGEE